MDPSEEPTAIYWPSGLKVARAQSQPTLKPSALKSNWLIKFRRNSKQPVVKSPTRNKFSEKFVFVVISVAGKMT